MPDPYRSSAYKHSRGQKLTITVLALSFFFCGGFPASACAKEKFLLGASFGIAQELALRGDIFWFPDSRFVLLGGASYLPGAVQNGTEIAYAYAISDSISYYAAEYSTRTQTLYLDALIGVHGSLGESGFVYLAVGATWASADRDDSRSSRDWSIDNTLGATIAAGVAIPLATRLVSYGSLRQRYASTEAEIDVLGTPLIAPLSLGGLEVNLGVGYTF